MTVWTAQAEHLADTTETAEFAAALYAAAAAAGLDPAPCTALAGVAIALGTGSAALMRRDAAPLPDDASLIAAADALDTELAHLQRTAGQLARRCTADLERARAALAAARSDDTRAMLLAQIADCDAALEILGQLAARLDYARQRLAAAVALFGDVYEAPQQHVRGGGVLPYDGRWLTGAGPAR